MTPGRDARVRHQAEARARRVTTKAQSPLRASPATAPGDADVLLQLSYMHSLAGHYRLAHDFAMQANAARPREPAVIKELIARLRTFNEGEALLDCVGRLPPLGRSRSPCCWRSPRS